MNTGCLEDLRLTREALNTKRTEGNTSLERMTPTPEQAEAIERMATEPTNAALNTSGMGTGKTLMAVETAKALGARVIVIVCPLGTRVGWERTLEAQGYRDPIRRIDSKKAGKEAWELLVKGEPGAYIVGREYFRRLEWAKVKKADIGIIDEVHVFSNRQSKGFKVLKTFKPAYRLALSGTPFLNKFVGMWAVCRWLWPDDEFVAGRSFHRWAAMWCKTAYNPFNMTGKDYVGEKRPGQFVKNLPCYVRLESDFGKPVIEERFVELSSQQRKDYEELERHGLIWLQENPLVVELPITMRIRLRQITLGTVTWSETGREDENGMPIMQVDYADDCKSSKISKIKEILQDLEDEPAVIYTHSSKFARVVAKRLGKQAALWSGDTSQDEREAILRTFGKEGGPKYLVATIAAIGEGVDGLQRVCSNMIWLSKDENSALNAQAEARLVRRGQTEQVTSYQILAPNTYDEGVFSKHIETQLGLNASLRKEKAA